MGGRFIGSGQAGVGEGTLLERTLRRLGSVGPLAVLAVILLVGAALRLTGIDWDQGQHLHPDERFLTMVVAAMGWPRSLAEYFDTAHNPLSPYNVNFTFFVYGTLPLYLVKWVGNALSMASYDQVHFVGRAMSAVFDLGSVVMIFLVGRRLYDEKVALLGAALLSLSVLNIQQSHFFTVDTFAAFFVVLGFYFAVCAADDGHWWEYALAGISLGAGVACKVSAYLLGVVIALAVLINIYRSFRAQGGNIYDLLERGIVRLVLAAVLSVLVFRVLQPITFRGPGFLDFGFNPAWMANMQEVSELMNGTRDTPPGQQWANRPTLFALQNLIVWGMGLPLGVTAWAGWAWGGYELIRRRRVAHLLPVVFVAVLFVNQGLQFVKSMRYLLALYPFLCLFAGYLLVSIWRWGSRKDVWPGLKRRLAVTPRAVAGALVSLVVVATLLYAVAFVSIYTRPHSRVAASDWIYANIPVGSTILNEHWDDGLPLRTGGRDGFATMYRGLEMPNYNDDNPEKLATMVDNLTKSNYLILSSNRLYGSIPRIPMRWPMTTRYYELLFAGKLGFSEVAEFTSYPQLFGISIPDQSAEEAFTVYDHPKVMIFKKTADFNADTVRHLLGDGINWNGIVRLRADQATEAPTGLNLSDADRAIFAAAGTWSQLYDRLSLANEWPVVAWAAVLLLLGLAALPLTYVALGALADRGYAFARALGLLLVGWATWMLGSAHFLEFGTVTVAIMVAMLALASGVALRFRGREMLVFYRSRWRLVAVEEVIFWLGFAFFVVVRAGNPDLWHPVMGGEKPMDFAYFNAVLKSPYFPPYDPWFAGGFINYYYFGWVLAGVLVKLTGIVPQVAYNLAVPTFYAFTAAGAFGVAYSLAEGWLAEARGWRLPGVTRDRWPWLAGLAGLLLVAVLGNLGEARLINDGFKALSKLTMQTNIPGVRGLAQSLAGAREALINGVGLPFRQEWWYWNPTRMIQHPSSEAGPITEFPFFSFLYGDLHAHVMALPYTLLALGFAVSILRRPRGEVAPGVGGWRRWVERLRASGLLYLVLPALVVGSLWPLNTWDFPTYAAVVGLAIACAEFHRHGQVTLDALWGLGWRLGTVLVLAYAAFLPFHSAYAGAYGSIEIWKGSRTGLDDFIAIQGLFLFLIITFLAADLWFGRGQNGVARLLRLAIRWWRRPRRAAYLYHAFVLPSAWQGLALDATLVPLFAALALIVLRQFVPALILVLVVLTAVLLLRPTPSPRRQFALGLIGLGLALTLAVEVVVLKGDISRMNTVFKFYIQVWVLWSIALAAMLPEMLGTLLGRRIAVAGSALLPEGEALSPGDGGLSAAALATDGGTRTLDRAFYVGGSRRMPVVGIWLTGLGLLVAASALYPWFATWSRIDDRFDPSVGATLDGAAYMQKAVYDDEGKRYALDWDRQAIEWLQDNVAGTPTIVEATTPIYRWGSRVSIYTGLPTIIGWDWHERQQRAILPGDVVDRRLADVRTIYTDTNPQNAWSLLRLYGVKYIYVGPVERVYYPGAGLNKFAAMDGELWEKVYANAEVQIYRVLP